MPKHESPKQKHDAKFPVYLKAGPSNEKLLRWLGMRLREIRAKETVPRVASRTNVSEAQIQNLESGIFDLDLGKTRDVLQRGYELSLGELLRQCCVANQDLVEFEEELQTGRKYYTVRLDDHKSENLNAPMLFGGKPEKFQWGIPLRFMANHMVEVELLELAPVRKRDPEVGRTPENIHSGSEVIQVIYGSIVVYFNKITEVLKSGETIHFSSSQRHRVMNQSNGLVALVLVVRIPELLEVRKGSGAQKAIVGASVAAFEPRG